MLHQLVLIWFLTMSLQCRDHGSSTTDDWFHCNYHPKTLEEIQSMLREKKEVVDLKRERALAYAFSQQVFDYFPCP
jgi:hypothetical protein